MHDELVPIIILIALILFISPADADVYVEVGVGLPVGSPTMEFEHPFNGPLGKVSIGVEALYDWSLELEHISSIPDANDGAGINSFWIQKRFNF